VPLAGRLAYTGGLDSAGRSRAGDAMDPIKLLVIAALLAIVFSLGSALFHLSSGRGNPEKMVRALTIRVGLSVALFILLLVAWKLGYIRPHGV
jgi:hypothetical protein